MRALLLAALLFSASAEARTVKKPSHGDPRIVGLGRSCHKTSDCKHPGQRCIVRSDAAGKQLKAGMCVLPCASYEAGTTKVTEGADGGVPKKVPPPRCPKTYQCRSAGAGVPIDICVKE